MCLGNFCVPETAGCMVVRIVDQVFRAAKHVYSLSIAILGIFDPESRGDSLSVTHKQRTMCV